MAGLTNRKSDIKRWVSHLDTNPLFPKNETDTLSHSLSPSFFVYVKKIYSHGAFVYNTGNW